MKKLQIYKILLTINKMVKEGKLKLGILLSLILIPFTSAYGGYSTFSIAQFTTVENIALFVFFLLAFFGIRKVLTKVFPQSNAAQVIVALILSIMGIYGIMQTNFSFEIFLYSLGINEELVQQILPWFALLFVLIVWWKWKFPGLMFILGGIFILLGLLGMASNSEIVYNWEYAFGIGAICLIIGAIFKKKLRAKIPKIPLKGPNLGNIKNPLKGGRLAVFVEGKRYPYPPLSRPTMTIQPGRGTKISVENIGSRDLKWKIKAKGIKITNITRGILSPRTSKEIKIFSDNSNEIKYLKVIAIGRLTKISRQKIRIIVYPSRTASNTPSGETKTPRPTRTRSARELQKKYNYYSLLIKKAQRANKGKIPKRGTPEGDLRHRHIQAMQSIEKMAKNQGVELK